MFINRELVERGFALWCEGAGELGEKEKTAVCSQPTSKLQSEESSHNPSVASEGEKQREQDES